MINGLNGPLLLVFIGTLINEKRAIELKVNSKDDNLELCEVNADIFQKLSGTFGAVHQSEGILAVFREFRHGACPGGS